MNERTREGPGCEVRSSGEGARIACEAEEDRCGNLTLPALLLIEACLCQLQSRGDARKSNLCHDTVSSGDKVPGPDDLLDGGDHANLPGSAARKFAVQWHALSVQFGQLLEFVEFVLRCVLQVLLHEVLPRTGFRFWRLRFHKHECGGFRNASQFVALTCTPQVQAHIGMM